MIGKAEQFIRDQIIASGPMDLGAYMGHVLGHPEFGYYLSQEPFGAKGDFVTAPEISQIFGELLGAWAVSVWQQMGKPDPFILLECGPGRGALIADLLRVSRQWPDFLSAMRLCFLEISPALKEKQRAAVEPFGVSAQWFDAIDQIAFDAPAIVLANEFLDALPVHQLQKRATGWGERCVGLVEDKLQLSLRDAPSALVVGLPPALRSLKNGEIAEISPERGQWFKALLGQMISHGGVALFVDYGHLRPGAGGTLQAVCRHQYCDIFENIGEADLSAHVDFSALRQIALSMGGIRFAHACTQGSFLERLGGSARAEVLSKTAQAPAQIYEVQNGYRRLVDSKLMGDLFKVMGVCVGYDIQLPGF